MLRETIAKLKGVKAQYGCEYYFNDSIKVKETKDKIESIVKSSDSLMSYSIPELPLYWYFNKGLQIKYSDRSDKATVEWLYYYISDSTQRKNIAIMDKWLKENEIK